MASFVLESANHSSCAEAGPTTGARVSRGNSLLPFPLPTSNSCITNKLNTTIPIRQCSRNLDLSLRWGWRCILELVVFEPEARLDSVICITLSACSPHPASSEGSQSAVWLLALALILKTGLAFVKPTPTECNRNVTCGSLNSHAMGRLHSLTDVLGALCGRL